MAQFICNFYSQIYGFTMDMEQKKKNKTKQDIKYYYKNKENNIRFIAEILILS